MQEQQQKMIFRNIAGNKFSEANIHILLCPQCHEVLQPPDVSSFNSCPYCNYKFEFNDEFEDYILERTVSGWVKAVISDFNVPEMSKGFVDDRDADNDESDY